jgi:hypothetical protein
VLPGFGPQGSDAPEPCALPCAPGKCQIIGAAARTSRQPLQALRIATADDDVIRSKGRYQSADDFMDGLFPALQASFL